MSQARNGNTPDWWKKGAAGPAERNVKTSSGQYEVRGDTYHGNGIS